MSLNSLWWSVVNGPRSVALSERWKLEWAFGSCVAVGLASFLGIYPPTQKYLTFHSAFPIGPAFAGCIAAAVKDVTIGATLNNGTSLISACFFASFLTYIVFACSGSSYGIQVALPAVFVLCFITHFIEFNPIGKRLSIAVIAINLLQPSPPMPYTAFYLFVNGAIGVICALVGCFFPWPQSARKDLRGRLNFNCDVVAALFKDSYLKWQYQCLHSSVNSSWAVQMPRSLETRIELIKYANENMAIIKRRVKESRYFPSEVHHNQVVEQQVKLLDELLLIIDLIEAKKADMRMHPDTYPVYVAFQNEDGFRQAVTKTVDQLGGALTALFDGDAKVFEFSKRLKDSLEELIREYTKARELIYWSPNSTVHLTNDVLLNMNSILFLLDTAANRVIAAIETPPREPKKISVFSVLQDVYFFFTVNAYLPQLKVWDSGEKTLTLACKRRLRQCLSLGLSMVIAGIYGFYGDRVPVSVAAFTIAFLMGDDVAGASVLNSLNRATGTVFGAVYTAIVLLIAESKYVQPQRGLFIGIATVISQIPAVYVRTFPIYGYVGTVVAFTIPILLLQTSISTQIAFNRIIDTYVGAAIFLMFEYLLAPQISDDILLQKMDKVFDGIKDHFYTFLKEFKSDFKAFVIDPSLLLDIKGSRTVILYSSHEISLFRPPPFEAGMVEEVMAYQEAAHSSLQVMTWASVANVDQLPTLVLKHELDLHLQNVREFMESISKHLSSATMLMKQWRRLAAQRKRYEVQELLAEGADVYLGETEIEQSRVIMLQYENDVHQLLTSYRGGGSETQPATSFEVMVVNTLLASSLDLLQALHGLSRCLLKMHAYWDIRTTQDGYRKPRKRRISRSSASLSNAPSLGDIFDDSAEEKGERCAKDGFENV